MRMLQRADVRLLWYADFWDYPRSGALEWQGQRYWFDEVEPGIGVFNVMELSTAQWDLQDAIHHDFRAHVGTHTDFTEPGNRTPIQVSAELHSAQLRPHSQWQNFYKRWEGHIERPEGPVAAQWRFGSAPWSGEGDC